MPSIFDLDTGGVQPTRGSGYDKEELAPGPRFVQSRQELRDLANEVLAMLAPPPEEVEQMRGNGWESPLPNGRNPSRPGDWSNRPANVTCHRWCWSPVYEIPIDSVIGQQHIHTYKWAWYQRLSTKEMGAAGTTIRQNRNNGVWAPVEIMWDERPQKRLGERTVTKKNIGQPNGCELIDDAPDTAKEVVELNTQILFYRVRYVDTANAPEIKLDVQGQPVFDVNVTVQAPAADGEATKAVADVLRQMAAKDAERGGEMRDVAASIAALAAAVAKPADAPKAETAAPTAPKVEEPKPQTDTKPMTAQEKAAALAAAMKK